MPESGNFKPAKSGNFSPALTQKDNDVDSNEIKGALDAVKDNYLELYKKIEDLYGK